MLRVPRRRRRGIAQLEEEQLVERRELPRVDRPQLVHRPPPPHLCLNRQPTVSECAFGGTDCGYSVGAARARVWVRAHHARVRAVGRRRRREGRAARLKGQL